MEPQPDMDSSSPEEKKGSALRDRGNDDAKPAPSAAGAVANVGLDTAAVSGAKAARAAGAAAGASSAAAAVPPGVFRAVWDDNNK